MSCKYHANLNTIGSCVDCGADYCEKCGVPITRHGTICLDCGVKFAWKKIIISTPFAIAGGIIGFSMLKDPASAKGIGMPPFLLPIVYAYFLWAAFFGYHYGGFWGKISDFFGDSMPATVILFAIRIIVAFLLGIFGGGIIQFVNYIKIIKRKNQLQSSIAFICVSF